MASHIFLNYRFCLYQRINGYLAYSSHFLISLLPSTKKKLHGSSMLQTGSARLKIIASYLNLAFFATRKTALSPSAITTNSDSYSLVKFYCLHFNSLARMDLQRGRMFPSSSKILHLLTSGLFNSLTNSRDVYIGFLPNHKLIDSVT